MSTDIPPNIAIKASALTQKRKGHHIFRIHAKKTSNPKPCRKTTGKTALFGKSLCAFQVAQTCPSPNIELGPIESDPLCHHLSLLAGCSHPVIKWRQKNHPQTCPAKERIHNSLPHLHAHSCIGSIFLTLLRGGPWSSKCVPQQEGSSGNVSQSILCRIPVINDNTPRPMPRVLIAIFEAIPSTVENPCQRWFNPWLNDLISREDMETWWRMQEHTTNTYVISCFTSSQQSLQVIRSGLKCGPPNFCSLTAQSAISLLNAFKCSAHWIWEYWIALKFATNQDGTGQHALECKNKMRFPPPCLIEEHAYIIPFSHKKMFPTRTSISIHIWHCAHLEHNVATWKLTCDSNLHQLLHWCFVCSINLFAWDPTLFRLQFQSTCCAHCDVFSIKKTHRISVDTRIDTR